MKIYNRLGGPFDIHWSADGETHTEEKRVDGKVIQRVGAPAGALTLFHIDGFKVSGEIPTSLGKHLLENWPKRFTADEGAIAAEIATAAKLAAQNQTIADHENRLLEIRDLVTRANAPGNKAAAKAAAEKLDALLKQATPVAEPLAPLPPPTEPAPAPKAPVSGVEAEQGEFEKAP